MLLPRRGYAAGLAAPAARPHGRQDRRRAAQVPHVSATIVPYQPPAAGSRSGSAPTADRCSRPASTRDARLRRRRGRRVGDAQARSAADAERAGGTRAQAAAMAVLAADKALARAGPGPPRPSRTVRVAPARPGGGPGQVGAGPAPGRQLEPRVRPEPTAPAGMLLVFQGRAEDRRGSSLVPASWPRAWSATGAGGRPSSIPPTSWCRPPPSRRASPMNASRNLGPSCRGYDAGHERVHQVARARRSPSSCRHRDSQIARPVASR